MTVRVRSSEGRMLHVLGPLGELRLPARAGVDVVDGATVVLRLGLGPCGEYQVLAATPVDGLPWRFGRVRAIEDGVLCLAVGDAVEVLVLGPGAAAELAVGAWAGAKVYEDEGRLTVLEARAMPGEVVQVGVFTEEDGQGFTVAGVDGTRCWRGDPGGFSMGDVLEVRGSWDPAEGFRARAYTPRKWPAVFRGDVVERDADALTVEDRWGLHEGRVRFEPPRPCDEACEAVVVGDEVEVDWHLEGGRPVADALRRREGARWAGKVERAGATELVVDTGGRTRVFRIDAETRFSRPVGVGDAVEGVAAGDRALVVAAP